LSRLGTAAARWIIAATLGSSILAIQTPSLASRLHVTPLHLEDWVLAALGGALVIAPILLEAASPPLRAPIGRALRSRPDRRVAWQLRPVAGRPSARAARRIPWDKPAQWHYAALRSPSGGTRCLPIP